MIIVSYLFLTDSNNHINDADLLRKLSLQEQHHAKAISNPKSRKLYLYSNLLKRIIISEHLHVSNRDLSFRKSTYGKPYLSNFPDLHFSISHSEGITTISYSDYPIGIDCERVGNLTNSNNISHFLSPDELRYTNTPDKCYEIWTKKEAYSKLKGYGLNMPFNSFSVLSETIDVHFYHSKINNYALSIATTSPITAFTPVKITMPAFLERSLLLDTCSD